MDDKSFKSKAEVIGVRIPKKEEPVEGATNDIRTSVFQAINSFLHVSNTAVVRSQIQSAISNVIKDSINKGFINPVEHFVVDVNNEEERKFLEHRIRELKDELGFDVLPNIFNAENPKEVELYMSLDRLKDIVHENTFRDPSQLEIAIKDPSNFNVVVFEQLDEVKNIKFSVESSI